MTEQADQAVSVEELQESIDELSAYRDRLYKDVVALGQKLRTIHHVVLRPQAILISTRSIGIVVSAVPACGEESEQTLVIEVTLSTKTSWQNKK